MCASNFLYASGAITLNGAIAFSYKCVFPPKYSFKGTSLPLAVLTMKVPPH
jgi:hypothetical protein